MGQQTQFSERERQAIELLIQGKSNKQIALALSVSVRTVEFHLSNIYAKLGVNSRTEAALKLTETSLRESTGADLRESTVVEMEKLVDNGEAPISTRRIPMKKFGYIVGGLLTTILLVLLAFHRPADQTAETITLTPTTTTVTALPPTPSPTPAVSAGEPLLEQIRQLAAEYEQPVQAEKKNGQVEIITNPNGEEAFSFKGESYRRIEALYTGFLLKKTEVENLYTPILRAEFQPTPFPTPESPDLRQPEYDRFVSQAASLCSLEAWQANPNAQPLLLYNPEEGKYTPIYYGEVIARCNIYGQMLEEWRTAPMMEQVNQDADMTLIRQAMGNPALDLRFDSAQNLANAPWQNAAMYIDGTGAKFYVDIETGRLAAIEPNYPTHPDIPPADVKSMDELRGVARQFANTNSPRLAELESALLYEEACKGDICFFRWDYRNKDWSGTDWSMMPPFLQVGVLTNGQIATYINTLDLFK